jgi:purine nucleoside phosphorylase
MEAIHLLRQMIEYYREKKKDLHMLFIDLEKAYDKVLREVLWSVLVKKDVSQKYITLIKNIYDGACTSVRSYVRMITEFSSTIAVH